MDVDAGQAMRVLGHQVAQLSIDLAVMTAERDQLRGALRAKAREVADAAEQARAATDGDETAEHRESEV